MSAHSVKDSKDSGTIQLTLEQVVQAATLCENHINEKCTEEDLCWLFEDSYKCDINSINSINTNIPYEIKSNHKLYDLIITLTGSGPNGDWKPIYYDADMVNEMDKLLSKCSNEYIKKITEWIKQVRGQCETRKTHKLSKFKKHGMYKNMYSREYYDAEVGYGHTEYKYLRIWKYPNYYLGPVYTMKYKCWINMDKPIINDGMHRKESRARRTLFDTVITFLKMHNSSYIINNV